MASETERKPMETAGGAQVMTRREAMLQLLRLGGAAAGTAAAAVWLSEHSFRPVPAQAELARRDHRIAADPQWPHLTVVQNGEPRALVQKGFGKSGRHRPLRQPPGRGGHQAQHCVGSHGRSRPRIQTPRLWPRWFANAGRRARSGSSLPTSVATSRAAASSFRHSSGCACRAR